LFIIFIDLGGLMELDPNLFEVIMDLERTKSNFMNMRNIRGRGKSIEEMWSDRILDTVMNSLISLAYGNHLLFNRYRDEYEQVVEESNHKRELARRLVAMVHFSLRLKLLIHGYRDLVSHHVDLTRESTVAFATYHTEKIYSDIFDFYLGFIHKSNYMFSTEVIALIREIERFNSNRRTLKISGSENEEIRQGTNEVKHELAMYYETTFLRELELSFNTFWYLDDVLLVSMLNNGDKLWEDIAKDKDAPILEDRLLGIQQRYYQARLEQTIGLKRINAGDLEEAAIEIKKSVGTVEGIFSKLGLDYSSDRRRQIHRLGQQIHNSSKLYELILELTKIHEQLIKEVEAGNLADIAIYLDQLHKQIDNHDYSFDQEYLSNLPTLYDNLENRLRLLLETDPTPVKILEQVDDLFENLERRLITATDQISVIFSDFDASSSASITQIDSILAQCRTLKIVNSLLPKRVPSKLHNNNRLSVLIYLALSIRQDIIAIDWQNRSPVQELIHRTKAHYLADAAYFAYNNLKTANLPDAKIKAQYAGTFAQSQLLQIRNNVTVLQYMVNKDVITTFDAILPIALSPEKEWTIYAIHRRLEPLDRFEKYLKSLARSSLIMREHKQIHGTVKDIDWQEIENLEHISKAILAYMTALLHVIEGTFHASQANFQDAAISLTEAKELGYEIGSLLLKTKNGGESLETVGNLIYNFATFCREAAANPQTFHIQQLPFVGALKVLKDFVFEM
jgi:hypothetical protein